jgi:hypothetical protein
MNAIPGRCNRPDSTQVSRRAQTPSPLASVPRHRPLPSYKEQLAEPRSERLAVRLRVMPARMPLPGPQWEGLLGGFRRRDERMREADRRADAAAASSPGRGIHASDVSLSARARLHRQLMVAVEGCFEEPITDRVSSSPFTASKIIAQADSRQRGL